MSEQTQTVRRIPYKEDTAFIRRHTYCNRPVMEVGDPYLFTDGDRYYFTGTNGGTGFSLWQSIDLSHWESLGRIFSKHSPGAWGTRDYWQPQILKGGDQRYYLYYCAHYPATGFSRIGVAVGDRVEGPYSDVYGRPLFDWGYSVIDPHLFRDDDGAMYLYYSRGVGQNMVNGVKTSQLYVVRMKSMTELADGVEPVLLTTPWQEWETASRSPLWNEGPDILKRGDRYYLFYSANCFAGRNYAIGYATSDSPMGPFAKAEENPVLSATGERISGPGNNSFFHSLDGREMLTAYHVHRDPVKRGGDRVLYIDRCGWRKDGTFYINGPTDTPQPQVSGVSSLERVTEKGHIQASTSQAGLCPENAYNGQIGMYSRLSSYEWASITGDKQPYWEIAFDQPQMVDAVFLYSSTVSSRRPIGYNLLINGQWLYTGVPSKEKPGEATVVKLEKDTYLSTLRITVQEWGKAECLGLSDIQLFWERGER